jgi:hypothetical protein
MPIRRVCGRRRLFSFTQPRLVLTSRSESVLLVAMPHDPGEPVTHYPPDSNRTYPPLLTASQAARLPLGFSVTCEHARKALPPQYRDREPEFRDLLNGPLGYDLGASVLAVRIAKALRTDVTLIKYTRLLVNLNEPFHLDFENGLVTRPFLPISNPLEVFMRWYNHENNRLLSSPIYFYGGDHRVIHLSVHTFYPRYRDLETDVDIGVIFAEDSPWEVALAERWLARLRAIFPQFRIEAQQPVFDLLSNVGTRMRAQYFPDLRRYACLCLDVNQRFVAAGGEMWKVVQDGILLSLDALQDPT